MIFSKTDSKNIWTLDTYITCIHVFLSQMILYYTFYDNNEPQNKENKLYGKRCVTRLVLNMKGTKY